MARDHVVGDGFPERIRIGALTRTFTPELVDFAIEEAGARERAVKSLPARLVVYFILAVWLFTSVGYGGVLRELVEHWPLKRGEKWRPASTGSLTKARSRLGAGALRVLFDRVRGAQGTPATPGVFWRNLRLTSLDGTTFNVPDSAANSAAYTRPVTGARQGPYPQVRLLALVESGTLAVIAAVFDSLAVGDRTLATRLLPMIERGTLLLADRGFPSYDLFTAAAGRGAELLWRASASFTLPVIEVLHDNTYLSRLNGPRGQRITVRVIEYTVHSTAEGADGSTIESSELFCLITTLLAPAAELAELYARRWTSETIFRSIKVEQRGGRTATLRSNSPEMVAQELWAMLCVYQSVRHLATDSVIQDGIPPAQISFKHALHAAQHNVRRTFPPRRLTAKIRDIGADLIRTATRPRPGRRSPRATKARHVNWPTLQPDQPATERVTTPSSSTHSYHDRSQPETIKEATLGRAARERVRLQAVERFERAGEQGDRCRVAGQCESLRLEWRIDFMKGSSHGTTFPLPA